MGSLHFKAGRQDCISLVKSKAANPSQSARYPIPLSVLFWPKKLPQPEEGNAQNSSGDEIRMAPRELSLLPVLSLQEAPQIFRYDYTACRSTLSLLLLCLLSGPFPKHF